MTDMRQAAGTFEVDFDGESPYDARDSITLGHDTGTKTFYGDMTGTSRLRMLSAVSGTPGSGGYVVIERLDVTLDGREGSFVLQHFGVMNRGEVEHIVQIVPDTGNRGLTGIHGHMEIDVVDGVHEYHLHYRIPTFQESPV